MTSIIIWNLEGIPTPIENLQKESNLVFTWKEIKRNNHELLGTKKEKNKTKITKIDDEEF